MKKIPEFIANNDLFTLGRCTFLSQDGIGAALAAPYPPFFLFSGVTP
jgi:hypothetical protein